MDILERPQEMDTDDAVIKDIQDEEIWMSDGNIIIATVDEAKKERRLYKCYRGLLSKTLPVLGEMFEADSASGYITASASEHYEGIPVIRLYDECEHVRQLLRVIHDSRKLPHKWWMRKTMNDLVGLLRLSRKYAADGLYKHCIDIFQFAWPTTLQKWDHREKDIYVRIWDEEDVRNRCFNSWHLIDHELPDPGAAISVAHEHGLHGSCIAAFYALNKVYRTPCCEKGIDAFPEFLSADPSGLSAALHRQFTDGREHIRYNGYALLLHRLPAVVGLKKTHTDEDSTENCEGAMKKWCEDMFIQLAKSDGQYSTDPLGAFKGMDESLDKKSPMHEKICDKCIPHLRDCLRRARQDIWDYLPQFFRVGDVERIDNLPYEFARQYHEHWGPWPGP